MITAYKEAEATPLALHESGQTDDELVAACRRGEQQAWEALIRKYKRLIYSVPVKFGLPQDAAADVFQSVCFELLQEITHLREPRALPKWLIQVASRKSLRWHEERQRFLGNESSVEGLEGSIGTSCQESHSVGPDAVQCEVEREEALRQALHGSAPRCRKLLQMLFFDQPPKAYREIAESLGVAAGSVGFIRGRCLSRLRRRLLDLGFS